MPKRLCWGFSAILTFFHTLSLLLYLSSMNYFKFNARYLTWEIFGCQIFEVILWNALPISAPLVFITKLHKEKSSSCSHQLNLLFKVIKSLKPFRDFFYQTFTFSIFSTVLEKNMQHMAISEKKEQNVQWGLGKTQWNPFLLQVQKFIKYRWTDMVQ